MEQTSNQEDELFKNIAIATVVSINDVNVNKEKPIIPENKSIIDDIAVAIAVSAASQSTSSDKPPEVVPVEDQSVVVATAVSAASQNEVAVEPLDVGPVDDQSLVIATAVSAASQNEDAVEPSNVPEPVHNIEEAIAIAVVRSSQNEAGEAQGNTGNAINQETETRTNGNPLNGPAHGSNTPTRTSEAENNSCEIEKIIKNGDETEKYITSQLIGFLNNKGIKIINEKNGKTEDINVGACGEIQDISLKEDTNLNQKLTIVTDYLSTIYELQ